ncbi:MAG: sel1 repeat family protein [Rhodoblastus sp.]|nr:MAG: sel1 repeat family protein [Rhodoblastus sp.]
MLTRAGEGVEKSDVEAARWMKQAADARNVAGELEYALMLFNGVGVAKDEPGAAKLLVRAANRDNPVAQNRLARLLAAGRGAPKNLVEAMKWHILARSAGAQDEWLDDQLATLSQEQRAKADEAVRRYLGR